MVKYSAVMVFFLVMCGGKQEKIESIPSSPVKQVTGKSVLMVIAPHDFRDEEFNEPYELLRKSGIRVVVASTDTTPAKGMLGMTVTPDITIDQIIPDSFDAIIVVGGTGCQDLWDNERLHDHVREFHVAGKVVAAICIAPVVLARAGILDNITVTAYPAVKDEIGKCGAFYSCTDVEVCGNVITGSGPDAAPKFSSTIMSHLNE